MPDVSAEVKTFGWIGIGNMGYGMAMSLASKMPPSARLVVNDINTTAVDKFIAEADSKGIKGVSKSGSPKELMAEAVHLILALYHINTALTISRTSFSPHCPPDLMSGQSSQIPTQASSLPPPPPKSSSLRPPPSMSPSPQKSAQPPKLPAIPSSTLRSQEAFPSRLPAL